MTVEIDGLRDAKGVVRLCLTSNPANFPKCKGNDALSASVKAANGARYTFVDLAPGRYALASFHDENGNGKLDTMLRIPREGFAFSRNPSIKPRPPRWDETSFDLQGDTVQRVHMHYLL